MKVSSGCYTDMKSAVVLFTWSEDEAIIFKNTAINNNKIISYNNTLINHISNNSRIIKKAQTVFKSVAMCLSWALACGADELNISWIIRFFQFVFVAIWLLIKMCPSSKVLFGFKIFEFTQFSVLYVTDTEEYKDDVLIKIHTVAQFSV